MTIKRVFLLVAAVLVVSIFFGRTKADDQQEINQLSSKLVEAINFDAGSQPNCSIIEELFIAGSSNIVFDEEAHSIMKFAELLKKENPKGLNIAEFSTETAIWFGRRATRKTRVNFSGKGDANSTPSKLIKLSLRKKDGDWKIHSMSLEEISANS